jgi:hypothetical protein
MAARTRQGPRISGTISDTGLAELTAASFSDMFLPLSSGTRSRIERIGRCRCRDLFRHVSAEKSAFYRCILDVFAAAKRQYRLQLRPDEVLAEAQWPDPRPRIEEVNALLAQLSAWGNLESQPDTARVSTLSDFYRARFLYWLSQNGEAVEAGLAVFFQTLLRRAELQSVALEDIAERLRSLLTLADAAPADVAKIHETLRDLVRVFEDLTENAQAFMADVARSIEFQQAEATAVATYKRRLIDYLERFMGDLVRPPSRATSWRCPPPSTRCCARWRSARHATRRQATCSTRSLPRSSASRPGANAGRDCAAGSCRPAMNRRRPICCGRGRGRPFPNCWAPSRS